MSSYVNGSDLGNGVKIHAVRPGGGQSLCGLPVRAGTFPFHLLAQHGRCRSCERVIDGRERVRQAAMQEWAERRISA